MLFTAGFTVGLGALVVGVLWLGLQKGQQRSPRLSPTTEVVGAPGDRAAVDAVGALGKVSVVVGPERLALTTEGGAEVLELFRVAASPGVDRLLFHANPVVRSYAAFHLMQATPDLASRLKPLLSDQAPVVVAAYDDQAAPNTVAGFVADLLCARKENEKVRAVLDGAARNWRLLGIRSKLKGCPVQSM